LLESEERRRGGVSYIEEIEKRCEVVMMIYGQLDAIVGVGSGRSVGSGIDPGEGV
jgi:hypothetical protein